MTISQRFQVFFDGDCPLCRREIAWLGKRDRQNRIEFVDIAGAEFEKRNVGKSFDELMAEIHGRTPEGEWVTGVDVFRVLYTAAGFRWLVAFSRWPLIRSGLNLAYRVFARYRIRLTGRCPDNQCSVPPVQERN